ncbi:HCL432Wp [Eremothecium sinecaudum]|uniref:HCL432Wp n=1 Tax=Eremothecium sinecaudum TaxID=45286 RepID=A0A109UY88_9SACH|nr:HCL432Wp [Eremothecium sinecaudum]AMD19719.1 HCL432Wp [Eremothecium sinecaudum]
MTFGVLRPLTATSFSFGRGQFLGCSQIGLVFIRTMMKTHKGTAKRWRKTAGGFKRGIPGRSHGSTGWGKKYLKSLSGSASAHSSHVRRLKRLLPYH